MPFLLLNIVAWGIKALMILIQAVQKTSPVHPDLVCGVLFDPIRLWNRNSSSFDLESELVS